jgi:hypothetical protein
MMFGKHLTSAVLSSKHVSNIHSINYQDNTLMWDTLFLQMMKPRLEVVKQPTHSHIAGQGWSWGLNPSFYPWVRCLNFTLFSFLTLRKQGDVTCLRAILEQIRGCPLPITMPSLAISGQSSGCLVWTSAFYPTFPCKEDHKYVTLLGNHGDMFSVCKRCFLYHILKWLFIKNTVLESNK